MLGENLLQEAAFHHIKPSFLYQCGNQPFRNNGSHIGVLILFPLHLKIENRDFTFFEVLCSRRGL